MNIFSLFKVASVAKNFSPIGLITNKYFLMGCVALAVFLYWNHRTQLIEEQQQAILNQTTVIAKLDTEMANLRGSINQQNKAIEQFAKDAKAREERLRKAEEESRQARLDADREVNAILQGNKPKTAQDAIQYLVDGVKDLKW